MKKAMDPTGFEPVTSAFLAFTFYISQNEMLQGQHSSTELQALNELSKL